MPRPSEKLPDSIVSGARTVSGVASHFEHLKLAVRPLLDARFATDRGYFTPSEDDEVRHLLVSYWQPRNALIELVAALHHDAAWNHRSGAGQSAERDRAAAFLVAWAGALVLVDAARFLRANCDHRPVVVHKLNEPEPAFGIPGGTYDRIQASLTSPVHAWHLYHAREYWNENGTALTEMAGGTELETLIAVIQRIGALNDIDLQRYAVGRLRVRTRQAETTGRDLVGRAMYGLQKAVSRLISGKYTHPGHSPQLPGDIAAEICEIIRPGDVFINRKEHAITNYFLPGYWPHAAFYIGRTEELEQFGVPTHVNGKPRWRRLLECDTTTPGRVVEAMKDGVWIRSLASPFAADAITVIRPQLPDTEIVEAIDRALFHDGKPYDFDFDFTRSDRLVCTEVVYRSFEGESGIRFPLTQRAGRLTLAAEDLLRMALNRQHFEVVAAYAPSHRPGLAMDGAAADLVRETLKNQQA